MFSMCGVRVCENVDDHNFSIDSEYGLFTPHSSFSIPHLVFFLVVLFRINLFGNIFLICALSLGPPNVCVVNTDAFL